MVKFRGRLTILTIENFDIGRGQGRDMVILKYWPWSWSKIFDIPISMTPGRRRNGQKSWSTPPPPPLCHYKLNIFDSPYVL